MIVRLRFFLLRVLRPFLAWSSGKHLLFTHKKITGKHYYQVLPLLKPGHIFLTKIYGELTSVIIPGHWSHLAIYCPQVIGNINEFVVEAEGPGVIRTDLVSFLTSKDEFMVLEAYLVPYFVEERAAIIAHDQIGKPYDYSLKYQDPYDKAEAFYCSGLGWWAYDTACAEFKVESPFVPREELGVPTISPDDVANSGNFRVIYDSRQSSPA